ncbi:predicted protein [Lichtheimia corymbifera JMRC:FSU:9682]|uniref:Uncharacterized protein n=1 Tax=Lichtheimia corymbifera JMRC:FSU:9682 TaxID=1263082 RepID=A0A068RZU5_9FUNG|nr:predicted protein [Lichtheimia corymbifera JMRC:FSU:9682]
MPPHSSNTRTSTFSRNTTAATSSSKRRQRESSSASTKPVPKRPAWDIRDMEDQLQDNEDTIHNLEKYRDSLRGVNTKEMILQISKTKADLKAIEKKNRLEIEGLKDKQLIHEQELEDKKLIYKVQIPLLEEEIKQAKQELLELEQQSDQETIDHAQLQAKAVECTKAFKELKMQIKELMSKTEHGEELLAEREQLIDQETKELEKETEKLDKLRQKLKEEERLRHHLEATVDELKAKMAFL